jgi:hypothetical protein
MAKRREIDETREWHEAVVKGFNRLESLVIKHRVEASRHGERYFGLESHEIQEAFRRTLGKHNRYALLALYATCEGGIRADACWRGDGNNGQQFNGKFRRPVDDGLRGTVRLNTLLQRWRSAYPDPCFGRRIDELQVAFSLRNKLAHGSPDEVTADFSVVYSKLKLIRDKWISFVPDFQGF